MDRQIEKKKWPPRKTAAAAIAALVLGAAFYSIIFADHSSRLNVERDRVTISTVTRGPFQEYIPVTGTVMPIKTHYLDAIEGGKVDTIYKEAGSMVQAGDRILRLTNTALLIQISNQDAMVVEQRNLLTNTRFSFDQSRNNARQVLIDREYNQRRLKRIFERQQQLYEENLISEDDFQQAQDDYEFAVRRFKLDREAFRNDSMFQVVQLRQLENSIQRLEQNLGIAQKRLEDLVIRAPIDGQLTSLNAEVGESKSQGERLGQIDVLDAFKVEAQIDEHYISRVGIGQRGTFPLAGRDYALVTRKVYPEVTNGSFLVDMEFTGEVPADIRRGQTVRVRLELGDLSEAVMLTRGGFYQRTGGNWAYVMTDDGGEAVKRTIRLGRQNTEVFEVLEGLQPGERVITSSYDNFGDHDKLILNN